MSGIKLAKTGKHHVKITRIDRIDVTCGYITILAIAAAMAAHIFGAKALEQDLRWVVGVFGLAFFAIMMANWNRQ